MKQKFSINLLFIFLSIGGLLSLASKRPGSGPAFAMASVALLDSRRKAYLNAKAALEQDSQYVVNNERGAVNGKKNIRMAQSYVWSEMPMTVSNSNYVLNVIDQQYNVGNTALLPAEKRVKQQDVFFVYAMWFGIRFIVGPWQGAQQMLFNFPPPQYNGVLPTFFPDVSTLVGIWTQGNMNVTVNGDVLTPAWDLSQHMVINQTQASVGGVPPNPYYNQTNQADDGWVITEPNWIINGGNNNIYQVNYGNNYSQIFGGVNTGCTIQVNMIMRLYGFLAQNASSIMNNAPAK